MSANFHSAEAHSFGNRRLESSPSARPVYSGVGPLAPMRVLIVEDESSVRDVLGLMLESDGHTVGSAANGAEGLELFCSQQWDIVLTDRAMPNMTGDQLAMEIKRRSPHMPVVMVSGLANSHAEPSPIDALVRKPFTSASLREGMAAALRAQASS